MYASTASNLVVSLRVVGVTIDAKNAKSHTTLCFTVSQSHPQTKINLHLLEKQ